MATVSVATFVDVPAAQAWEAIADVGAVHERLLPGRVASAEMDGDVRILTMPNGTRIRELIIAVDHELRRMAYSVIEGQAMPLTYHHAAFQVVEVDGRTRVVWTTDVLPHALAGAVQARVERGIVELKAVLESA
ncbi:SRPBCC family protein [Actinoplanes sp. NPDC020271]|uniref:SRPBCC family protein n=1 Tax=Actinoplanes sp. NPDC020271 TaxID=3363896 RepID=UPI0037B29C18